MRWSAALAALKRQARRRRCGLARQPLAVSDGTLVAATIGMKTSSPRIVIADSDPLVLDALVMLLELEGYTVRSCRNGHEALELCLRYKPDMVLVDIDSPSMQGYALARAKLTNAAGDRTRRIGLTSRIEAMGNRARLAGFDRLLEKPVEWSAAIAVMGDSSAFEWRSGDDRAAA